MSNVLQFPIIPRGATTQVQPVFGKRAVPPEPVRHSFGPLGLARLTVFDRRADGRGFTGEFSLNSEDETLLPVMAVGKCPGEVYTKLARMPELADFKGEILGLEISPLDWAMQR